MRPDRVKVVEFRVVGTQCGLVLSERRLVVPDVNLLRWIVLSSCRYPNGIPSQALRSRLTTLATSLPRRHCPSYPFPFPFMCTDTHAQTHTGTRTDMGRTRRDLCVVRPPHNSGRAAVHSHVEPTKIHKARVRHYLAHIPCGASRNVVSCTKAHLAPSLVAGVACLSATRTDTGTSQAVHPSPPSHTQTHTDTQTHSLPSLPSLPSLALSALSCPLCPPPSLSPSLRPSLICSVEKKLTLNFTDHSVSEFLNARSGRMRYVAR